MSNRDCENFREAINMNTDPSRENADKKAYEDNIKAWAEHIFKITPISFNDDDRDPIGDDR